MSENLTWRNEQRRLGDLLEWEQNPKRLTEEAAESLQTSIRKFGFAVPILIDPDGEIIDGNQRHRLLAMMDEYGPDAVVDVRVASRKLTWDERREFVIRLVEAQAEWDFDALANIYEPEELAEWGFTSFDFEDFMPPVYDTGEDDGAEHMERADELQKLWMTERGQLWRIPSRNTDGVHYILCGDSTSRDDVNCLLQGVQPRMVFTDPPYGVAIGAKNRLLQSVQKAGRTLHDIVGDSLDSDKLYALLRDAFTVTRAVMADDASLYCTAPQGGDLGLMMLLMMADAGLPVRHVLIWVKNQPTFSLGRLDYDYQHEPIFYTWKKKHHFFGRGEHTTSTWFIDRPRASKEHPTMKPVELVINALLNSTEELWPVYDPFLGSGTTLVACERTSRVGYGMEIEPRYVAVALQRLADMGLTPELIT